MAEIEEKKGAARILLAEDEPSVQKMVEKRLQANGYEVILANDGEQALKLARETRPDVIVMDIVMPKLGGDEVASYLQRDEKTASIPVIFMTCLVKPEEAIESEFMIGINVMLPKPIDSAQLLSMIKKTLDR